jgi:hypothetical protein
MVKRRVQPGEGRSAVRRLRGLTVLVAVVALFTLALYARREVQKPLAYWPVDDRTLGVVVLEGIYIECEIARIDESADTVRIWAECLEPLLPVPMAAALHFNVFQVALAGPLANRTVLDGLDNPGELCPHPAPDCVPPS